MSGFSIQDNTTILMCPISCGLHVCFLISFVSEKWHELKCIALQLSSFRSLYILYAVIQFCIVPKSILEVCLQSELHCPICPALSAMAACRELDTVNLFCREHWAEIDSFTLFGGHTSQLDTRWSDEHIILQTLLLTPAIYFYNEWYLCQCGL